MLVVSCSFNHKSDLDIALIKAIMRTNHFSDSNLVILDFKQGRFNQELRNDTAILSFNGFIFTILPDPLKATLFSNLDSINGPFFNTQGFLNNRLSVAHALSEKYIIKYDSLPENAKNIDYYHFNWEKTPDTIKGFVSFSEPIVNKQNVGFIVKSGDIEHPCPV